MQLEKPSINPVLTKRDFVGRYKAGEFGNAAPTWHTLQEYQKSFYCGMVHIRNRIAGGPTWYDVAAPMVTSKCHSIVRDGWAKYSDLYFSGMAPHKHGTIQGEVQRSTKHIDLYYTYATKPMRDALREWSKQLCGLEAINLLKRFMDTASYEWLWHLLDTYPDHVVEFSSFSVNWGTVPHRNTVFWECRAY